jgi:hypothetical protein
VGTIEVEQMKNQKYQFIKQLLEQERRLNVNCNFADQFSVQINFSLVK